MYIQILICIEEEFEDAKGVIRIRKSKSDKQHNGLRKRAKGQQEIFKLLNARPITAFSVGNVRPS
jgi:peptidyl-tRNA hydrolase